MEDAELLTRYCETRSEAAFSELVSRHLKLVYSAALRRLGGDRHAAEDVAQHVFTELARQAASLASRSSLEGWLYTTTRNVAVQRIRAEHRRAVREREAMMTMDEHDSTKTDVDQLRPLIDPVLDQLRERDRELILLRFYRGNAFADIARGCGISEDAARFRVNRALEKLKRLLQKRGIDSAPAALALVFADHANAATATSLVNAVARGALSHASVASHAGGSLAETFHLMSNIKIIAAAAVLVACTGGFLLQRESTQLAELRSELASRENEYQFAARQLAKANSDQRASDRQTPTEPKSPASAADAATSGSSPRLAPTSTMKSASGATPSGNAEVNWVLSRDPDIRAALAEWMGSSIRTSFAAFFRSANLSPPQIAAFEALELQHNINMGVAMVTLRPENEAASQVDVEMRELLGDRLYQQYAQYRQTQFVRGVALELAGFVHDTDTPLSAQQAEQLTQVLAQSSPPYQNGGLPFPKDIDWNAALPRARTLLSESQFAALNELATLTPYVSGGMHPARPGKFGEGTNPPPALYQLGKTSK